MAVLDQAARQVAHNEVPPLHTAAELQSLGLDSVQLLEMVAIAEAELGLRIPNEAFGRVRTAGELCGHFVEAAAR
jgi:acyl carrier protein